MSGPQKRSVTIKDMASELGLSITTISRALNGYADVGEKTRKRVSEAALRLGYRPNRNAQRLVKQRTHSVAWIQSDNDRKFVDPHFVEVLAGVLRGARAGNYDIMLTSHTPEHQMAVYDSYVRDNSVDGFIVDLPRRNDSRISYLIDVQRPFVVHGRDGRHNRYGWVDIDNAGIFGALTRLMVDNGHKRIAFINGDEQFAFAAERRRGVEEALDTLGVPRDTVRIYNALHPMGDAGFQLTTAALDEQDITAVLYSSTLMAVEGQSALVRAGRKAGDNVVVATMDDQLHYLDLSPFEGQFTFVRSSLRDAGSALISELIRECDQEGAQRGVLIPHSFAVANGMDARALGSVTKT